MWNEQRCPGCGASGWSPCQECVAQLTPARQVHIVGARHAEAVVEYVGVARDLVHSLKYGGARDLAPWFAGGVALTINQDIDFVTWLPTTKARKRARGYDQAQLLARAVGRASGVTVRRLLRRVDTEAPQTGRTAIERAAGPRFRGSGSLGLANVLLVDDVVTTGASATNAVATLLNGGAGHVDVTFVARTPAPADRKELSARWGHAI